MTPSHLHSSRYVWVQPQRGRLGNIMFQYAGMMSVADVSGHQPIVACDTTLTLNFPTIAKYCWANMTTAFRTARRVNIYEQQWGTFDASIYAKAHKFHAKHAQLCCYFQSWKYTDNISTKLKQHFRFSAYVRTFAKQHLEFIIRKHTSGRNVTLIGVHVRRSDMTSRQHNNVGYTAAPLTYYLNAMTHYRNQFSNCVFLVASDDVRWCRKHVTGDDVITIQDYRAQLTPPPPPNITPEARDMSILRLVDHSIISTGSFSWWIGWFTPGQVVYYKNYPANGSALQHGFTAADYYPQHWTGML